MSGKFSLAKTAARALAAVFFLALGALVFVLGPPLYDAQNAIGDAERDGRIDARTWQETMPAHVGAALMAAEFSPQDRGLPAARYGGLSGVNAIASRIAHDPQRRTLRDTATRAFTAILLDAKYRPDQLVDDFARLAYFGRGAYGAEAGARAWFGKPLAALSVDEAAFLGALLKSPSRPNAARRDYVLARMHAQGRISDAELAAALASPLNLAPPQLASRS